MHYTISSYKIIIIIIITNSNCNYLPLYLLLSSLMFHCHHCIFLSIFLATRKKGTVMSKIFIVTTGLLYKDVKHITLNHWRL